MVTNVKTSAVLVEMWLVTTEGVWLIIEELVIATESTVDELKMIVLPIDVLLEKAWLITDETGSIDALEEVWLVKNNVELSDAVLEGVGLSMLEVTTADEASITLL